MKRILWEKRGMSCPRGWREKGKGEVVEDSQRRWGLNCPAGMGGTFWDIWKNAWNSGWEEVKRLGRGMERGGLVWSVLQEVRLQRVIWDSTLGPGPAIKLKHWRWECLGSRWAVQPFACSNSYSQVKSCQQSIKSLCLRLSARKHGSETSQFWIRRLPHICPPHAPLASRGRSPWSLWRHANSQTFFALSYF